MRARGEGEGRGRGARRRAKRRARLRDGWACAQGEGATPWAIEHRCWAGPSGIVISPDDDTLARGRSLTPFQTTWITPVPGLMAPSRTNSSSSPRRPPEFGAKPPTPRDRLSPLPPPSSSSSSSAAASSSLSSSSLSLLSERSEGEELLLASAISCDSSSSIRMVRGARPPPFPERRPSDSRGCSRRRCSAASTWRSAEPPAARSGRRMDDRCSRTVHTRATNS